MKWTWNDNCYGQIMDSFWYNMYFCIDNEFYICIYVWMYAAFSRIYVDSEYEQIPKYHPIIHVKKKWSVYPIRCTGILVDMICTVRWLLSTYIHMYAASLPSIICLTAIFILVVVFIVIQLLWFCAHNRRMARTNRTCCNFRFNSRL